MEQSVGDFILSGYDYESLLHYGSLAFSANGEATLQARDDPMRVLGQTDGLSRKDIEKVNKLYKCKGNICYTYEICSMSRERFPLSRGRGYLTGEMTGVSRKPLRTLHPVA